jgi:hypothetical protein
MNPRPLNEMQLALMGIPVGGTAVEGSAGGQRRGVRAARARSPADATARPETAKEEAEEEAKEKAEEAMKEEAKEEAEEAMKEEAAAEASKKRKKEPPVTEEEDYHLSSRGPSHVPSVALAPNYACLQNQVIPHRLDGHLAAKIGVNQTGAVGLYQTGYNEKSDAERQEGSRGADRLRRV